LKRTYKLLTAVAVVGMMLPAATPAFAQFENWQSITDEFLNNPPDEAWPSKRRVPGAMGYSPLDQITRDNVNDLELAFVLETGVLGANEGTPVVVNGVMFFQARSQKVIAADAATGRLLWEYKYDLLPAEQRTELGVAGDGYSRGVVVYEDMILANMGDSHVVAIDAKTGQEIWRTQTNGMGYTSPGIIANGVLVSGNRAKNYDRGSVTGIDAKSGEILWEKHMIPGPGEPGYETWEVEGTAEIGHASIWGSPTYDPVLNLVYIFVGNPDPYTPETRPGDNLYTNSVVALNPQTGEIVWYHQFVPNDAWDVDSVMEGISIDAEYNGEMRHLMIHTGKSGFTNLLDRETGEWLDHTFTTYQNIFESVDENGRPTMVKDKIPRPGERVIACPSTRGGTDWPARAYSPDTGLYYLSGNHICMDVEGLEYSPGDPMRNLDDIRVVAPGYEGRIGAIFAIDPLTMEKAWTVEIEHPTSTIPLPTAGGLIFTGEVDNTVRAYADDTGELLWTHPTSNPGEGHPISYEVDGVQYVAFPTGCCSIVGAALARENTPEIMSISGTNQIWVFRLPQD
jgi:PQQ-dependent dehydrogenase (methanol/ethanol family)